MIALATSVQAQFTYVTNNGTITITGYNGTPGDMTIPARIDGMPVDAIKNYAFLSRSGLGSLTISSDCRIGKYAFETCPQLGRITINGGNISIESAAFISCRSLTNVTILNGAVDIGLAPFSMCAELSGVTISNCVANIGDHAFEDSYKLNCLALSEGVVHVGDFAFAACQSLTGAAIPNSVTNLGRSAFDSSGLHTVTVPAGLVSIGLYAFRYCPDLTIITVDAQNPFYSDTNGVLFDNAQTTLIQYPAARFGVHNNQFGFTISRASGLTNVIEACTCLSNPDWQPIVTNSIGTDGTAQFSDPQWTNYPARSYRVSWP
ncbi:MAG TPA: leucine-rich repeat protein [Verrucomicrobiae bacterium]